MPTATATRERPILFTGAMVRAILAGTKTQTRRIVKPQPGDHPSDEGYGVMHRPAYGVAGDRLWVRETFCELIADEPPHECRAYYAATHEGELMLTDGDGFQAWRKDGSERSPWRPSIHMPRRLCRLVLGITDVRVQRLQDISEADAVAEGIVNGLDGDGWVAPGVHTNIDCSSPSLAYRDLWNAINGAGSWDANPWVWAISFKRIEGVA